MECSQLTQNGQEKVNLTVPKWIVMRTRLDGGLVHGCDEVNTRVKEWTHDKAGYMWWRYRYGTLTTPKSSPSAERVIQTQGKTQTVATKRNRPRKRSPLWYFLLALVYLVHSLITLFDHSFSFFWIFFSFSLFWLFSKLGRTCYSIATGNFDFATVTFLVRPQYVAPRRNFKGEHTKQQLKSMSPMQSKLWQN